METQRAKTDLREEVKEEIFDLEEASKSLFGNGFEPSNAGEDDWTQLRKHQDCIIEALQRFFELTRYPSAPGFRNLDEQKIMTQLLWTNIIRLLVPLGTLWPRTSDQFVAFFVSSYTTIAWLSECTTGLEPIWFSLLGRLAAWRAGRLEKGDLSERIYHSLARAWYFRAQDLSPSSGRLQYHLSCLPCPYTQKLAFLCGALLCPQRDTLARGEMESLFHRFQSGTAGQCHHAITTFMLSIGQLYTRGDEQYYTYLEDRLAAKLESYIKDRSISFCSRGAEIGVILCAALVGFGNEGPQRGWAIAGAFRLVSLIIKRLANLVHDQNIFPLVHVMLARLRVLWEESEAPEYLYSPELWTGVAEFLNNMAEREVIDGINVKSVTVDRRLPEDFLMRPLTWASHYLPANHFDTILEEERYLELQSNSAIRAARMRTLGMQLALHRPNQGLWYDVSNLTFSVARGEEGKVPASRGSIGHHRIM